MLRNNLKAKILFSFALILPLVVVLSLFACWQLNNLDKTYGELFMVRIEKVKDAYGMQVNVLNMAYAAPRLPYLRDPGDLRRFSPLPQRSAGYSGQASGHR
ncbi:MAG: hypothetical protein H5T99_04800, partial [Moorella sp. (in: Bacteria)]|nr:hypothetical protein [Moorella sp. (in: firmicutes)]